MAITTWETVDILTDAYNEIKIGLSKPINELSYNDIASNCYCASSWYDLQNPYTIEKYAGDTRYWDSVGDTDTPVTLIDFWRSGANYWGKIGVGAMDVTSEGITANICFVYGNNTDFDNNGNLHASSNAKIVTKLEPSLFRIINTSGVYSIQGNVYDLDTGITRNVKVQYKRWLDINHSEFTWVDCSIIPCMIFSAEGNNYITALYSYGNSYDISTARYSDDNIVWKNKGFSAFDGDGTTYDFTYGTNLLVCMSAEDLTEYLNSGNQFNAGNSNHYSNTTYTTDVAGIGAYYKFSYKNGGIIYGWYGDYALDYLSRYGLYFHDTRTNKDYKPIISGGWVTGYTDDLTTPSEIDDYTYEGGTSHDIQPAPPVPPAQDEISGMDVDMLGTGMTGAVKYYTMDNAGMSTFMSALEDATAEHPNIADGFISATYIPRVLDSVVTATSMGITVKGVTLSANGNKVITQKPLLLASFNVPSRHHNAFDNLTKYFIYTPFTDVIPLNYKCYGRKIDVYMFPSIQDCTADIVIQCAGLTIAKQTVSMGSSLAIAVENSAEKSTAIVNACCKYLGSAGAFAGGVATGNVLSTGAGAVGIVASTVNVMNTIGNSYIHSYGTTTGTTISIKPNNICMIEYVAELDKPSNFASATGNLVNKEMTLSQGMGFTKIGNPRINTNLTAPEYAELINTLESGVIL